MQAVGARPRRLLRVLWKPWNYFADLWTEKSESQPSEEEYSRDLVLLAGAISGYFPRAPLQP